LETLQTKIFLTEATNYLNLAMKRLIGLLLLVNIIMSYGYSQQIQSKFSAPKAVIKPFKITSNHGHIRTDNYYWLNDRENQEVIDYLNAENQYFENSLGHTKNFQENLFNEMRARIKEDDSSVPYKLDDYYYYNRYVEGGEYPIYCRKKDSMEGKEEIIMDGNELGQNKSFLYFFTSISPDHNLAAIMIDTVGRNFFHVIIKDLRTGELLPDTVENIRSNAIWTNDNQSFYYAIPDPKTLRNFQIKRHYLGKPADKDELIFEENDQTLSCYVEKTKSKDYIIISSARTDASYSLFVNAHNPEKPKLISPIKDNIRYRVDHARGNNFHIYTNLDAVNYRLVEAPIDNSSADNWKDVISHRHEIFLENVDYFKDFFALHETKGGLANIRIIRWADHSEHQIEFDEPAYSAQIGENPAFETELLRYSYTSMTTPRSIYDFNSVSKERTLMKEQPILGNFKKENYETERVIVTARDGALIPMSIVYRKDKFKNDGSMPGLIYGYGSYGMSLEPTFSSVRLSLLDRGVIYAIAHIRGGQELGGRWYEEGKMMNKKNTFYDFIDCSKWLQNNKYVAKDKLFAQGGSAGGLLMGAVANMAPEIYRGIITEVAFVDVLTTMMDETIPLTTFEWLEWGNPNIVEQYEYMLSYSPYDNVEAKSYPNILATTGLHDSQVQYWEPAKWVAKLKELKTDNNNVFLYTKMDAGHGGASGRFQMLKDIALKYAFVFDILGIEE